MSGLRSLQGLGEAMMALWLERGTRLLIRGRRYRVHLVDNAALVVYVYTWRDVVATAITVQELLPRTPVDPWA